MYISGFASGQGMMKHETQTAFPPFAGPPSGYHMARQHSSACERSIAAHVWAVLVGILVRPCTRVRRCMTLSRMPTWYCKFPMVKNGELRTDQSVGDDDRFVGELAAQQVEKLLDCGQDDDAGGGVVSGRLSAAPLSPAAKYPRFFRGLALALFPTSLVLCLLHTQINARCHDGRPRHFPLVRTSYSLTVEGPTQMPWR